jgi:hypothetical protein
MVPRPVSSCGSALSRWRPRCRRGRWVTAAARNGRHPAPAARPG